MRLSLTVALLTGFALATRTAFAEPPVLGVGVWTRITPAGVEMSAENHVFCQGMAIDPSNPDTLYLCICAYDVAKGGLYKSTDRGRTWRRIGQLDEPIHIVVDPADSKHLYCVDGVRGQTLGFWESRDGGESWQMPDGFVEATKDPIGTRDLYHIAVDPTDFSHIVVTFHSPWRDTANAGILESKDGGKTWTAHAPPAESKGGYGMAVFFLFDPQKKIGDANTWLFTAQQGGFFRTTDGGKTWSIVFRSQMTHGGNQLYRAADGTLYSGGYQYPARSADNGASWQQIKNGLIYSWYMGICGDGENLYTAGVNENQPFFTSAEADGLTWSAYSGGKQKFSAAPFEMFYDAKNRIMYAASWHEGLLALKVR
jgi:photosystem II stability/assembly factor-like uncharacterized protein